MSLIQWIVFISAIILAYVLGILSCIAIIHYVLSDRRTSEEKLADKLAGRELRKYIRLKRKEKINHV